MLVSRRSTLTGLAGVGVAACSSERDAPTRTPNPDVIVLGAGISGLNAAWLLEQEGLRVLTLEARNRVGGRVHTLMDQPGYPEMGFNTMAAGYGRGIDAASRAGVELVDIAPRFMSGPPQQLVLRGQLLTPSQWADSPLNPLPADLRTMMPWEVVPAIVSMRNPLPDWAEWMSPARAALDISMHEFLSAQGLSDDAIRLVFDTAPYYGTSSYDVSALVYAFNDGWVKTQREIGVSSLAIKGGNQQLPEAMARLLRGDILFEKEVVAISSDTRGATVTCRDGSSYRAAHVVCSLPFSTLRNIDITPALSGPQAQAVTTLPYQPITLVFLTVRSPYWQEDGLSPSMWTDGPLGSVLAQRFGETDEEVTGLLASARGELAQYWDRLGAESAKRLIVAELERLRPAARGKVTATAYHSWAAEPFNAGDWGYFGPGQVTRFANAMSAPAGRLHFCGEHTATSNRGLEGALESSERVFVEILNG